MMTTRHFIFVPFIFSAPAAEPHGPSHQRKRRRAHVVTTKETTPEQHERAIIAADADTPATRDALELWVVTTLEAFGPGRTGTTNASERQPIEKQISDAQDYKVKLYGQLKQLHGTTIPRWETLRKDVDATIADLCEVLGNQRQKPNLLEHAQPTQPPKTHGATFRVSSPGSAVLSKSWSGRWTCNAAPVLAVDLTLHDPRRVLRLISAAA